MGIEDITNRLSGANSSLLLVGALITSYLAYVIVDSIYNAFFGPLRNIPGPLIRKFTILPYARAVGRGEQHRDILKLHEKYGPVVRFAPRSVMFATQPAWKDIYGFKKGGAVPKDPQFYGFSVNGSYSVATATTADHSRQRKIFSNAFSDRALKQQEPLIKQWAAKLSEKLGDRATDGKPADVLKLMNCTTFDIMGDLTFGESLNMLEDSEYTPWVKTIFDGIKTATMMRSFKYLGSLPQYLIDDVLFKTKVARDRMLEHWDYSAKRVDARLARKAEKPDIWSLVEGREKEHGGLSLGEHHANGNVFMIAGTETTATALSGITYLLLKNPETLTKLNAEIRQNVPSFDDLTLENLQRLKYMHAVLQEGLRLYPPAPIDLPRLVPAGGLMIDGHFMPAGTRIGLGHYATYRMESHFTEPNEFRPERWLGDPKYKNDNLNMVEPFSIGPRNCLGKNLAWHEMRVLLATLILGYDMELLPESDGWIETQHVYTLWEKKPLWCKLSHAPKA